MAAHSVPVAKLVRQGVDVWADDFSLSVRAFGGIGCAPGVRLGGVRDLVRLLMAAGVIPVWH
jgi:hypothetical protein